MAEKLFGGQLMKDECGICGRVMRTTYMRQCQRCKKMFCRDCMVPDVATGDPNAMLCLHCARRIVSPRTVSKYAGLESHLKFRAAFTDKVTLKFARIDGLIGSNLPMAAYREEAWWSNTPSGVHAKAWLNAGWEVEQVNLKEGTVTFHKVRVLPKKRKKNTLEITEPFTPVRVRPLRSKVPSKTKVSKLYARIKNLERQRNMPQQPLRGFKPKSRYQKKLFKSNQKPHS
ncbi:MAG: PHD finger domain-containing protein [Candidatus Bathyarchaeota archaeon]|nr:PHD finger domain-containing protein [Candidatus Bathyarchaeota archaeon]